MGSLSFKTRSYEKEILDDFELQGNDLKRNLRELERINRFLGGYAPILKNLKVVLQEYSYEGPLKISDAGCGGGDMLRKLSDWSGSQNIEVQLTGLDGNPNVLALAREFAKAYPIQWQLVNVLSPLFSEHQTDVLLFNLFMHHFSEEQIIHILRNARGSSRYILINDLQRSPLAYRLFQIVSRIFNFSYVSKHDGKLSIRKSFTRADWEEILKQAGIEDYSIRWQWAFRYSIFIRNL